MLEYIVYINKYSRKFIDICFEKLMKNTVSFKYIVYTESFFSKWYIPLNSSLKNTNFNLHENGIFNNSRDIWQNMFHTPKLWSFSDLQHRRSLIKKKHGSNIFLKSTFTLNFIKIGESNFGMFPCESITVSLKWLANTYSCGQIPVVGHPLSSICFKQKYRKTCWEESIALFFVILDHGCNVE